MSTSIISCWRTYLASLWINNLCLTWSYGWYWFLWMASAGYLSTTRPQQVSRDLYGAFLLRQQAIHWDLLFGRRKRHQLIKRDETFLDVSLQCFDIHLWLKLLRSHHFYSWAEVWRSSFSLTFTHSQKNNQSELSTAIIQAHSDTKDAAVGAILRFSVLLKGLGTNDLHVASTHILKARFCTPSLFTL